MPETATQPEVTRKASEPTEIKATEGKPETAKPEGFDFDKWLNDQPKEAREALQKNEHGLKSALDKTREDAAVAQKELKRIERERVLAEEQKAKDEGRFKDHAEAMEKRAKAAEAKLEAEEWTKATRAGLKEAGVGHLEEYLLASRETSDQVVATGKKLDEAIEAEVQARVAKKLTTTALPVGTPTMAKKISEMTKEERAAHYKSIGVHQ